MRVRLIVKALHLPGSKRSFSICPSMCFHKECRRRSKKVSCHREFEDVKVSCLKTRTKCQVMGLYPGDPGPPGADCAGTVLDVGERVDHLRTQK